MAATEIQQTAGITAGTWNTVSNAAYSGGSALASGAPGSTITFTASGRAIWLLTATSEPGGQFSVTVDGVPGAGGTSFGVGANTRYRVLLPLARGLSDGPHTVVITAAGAAPVLVDAVIAVSGDPLAPVPGQLAALGDSIASGYGLANPFSSWPTRVGDLLGRKLGRPFSVTNRGLPGDSLFAMDGTHPGGMYRTFSEVAPLNPEILAVMFGVNDIFMNVTLAGDFTGHLFSLLQFVEDLFAVEQMAVLICVPTYLAPISLSSALGGNQSGYYAGCPADHYRVVLELAKVVTAQFPWATVAYTHEVLDDADSLIFPNGAGSGDSTHLNDGGHSVVAIEIWRAVLERFAAIGRA